MAVRFSNWLYDPASKLQQYTVCQCRHLIFTSFFSNENLSTKFGQKEVKLQYWTKGCGSTAVAEDLRSMATVAEA